MFKPKLRLKWRGWGPHGAKARSGERGRHEETRPSLALALIIAGLPISSASAGSSTGAAGYLVASASPLTAAQVTALTNAGIKVKHVYQNFGGAAVVASARSADAIRRLPFVTGVSADTVKQLDSVRTSGAPRMAAPAAALPGTPYWLDLIDAEKNTSYDGSGVWVAVLDSGFYPNWRDYFDPAKILTDKARAFVAANANSNQNQWDVGSDPHGMATAATGAAGTYDVPGVAPGAKVIPIKVCEPIGCFGSAINAGVDYVTSLKKANPGRPIVINESLGGSTLDATEKAAIDAALKAGVVLVASAGNEGDAGMGFPGAYEPVVSAGAGGWIGQWNEYPDKTWWLDNVPENDINQVFVADFSSRQRAAVPVPVPQRHQLLGTDHRRGGSAHAPEDPQPHQRGRHLRHAGRPELLGSG